MSPLKISLFLVLLLFSNIVHAKEDTVFNDVSRLNPTTIFKIVEVRETKDILESLQEAKSKGLKISIAGKRHSQGGQQSYPNGIVLDMLDFNKVISLDVKNKIIRVEAGATWGQVQEYIAPYGLAIKVMQASNIFTVGGSLGSNIHGNDPQYGTILQTVRSFHLIRADGALIRVSRNENSELFNLVIGGYGLFGVITDIDLELTDDVAYQMTSQMMDYTKYLDYFKTNILADKKVGLYSAKLSNAPGSLLKEVVATAYVRDDQHKDKTLFKLRKEGNISRNKFFFGLSRKFNWGKSLRWYLEKRLIAKVGRKEYISRNNSMRSIVEFLEYHSSQNTDILQEYYIPMDKFVAFVDGLRGIVKKENINLLSVTIRYVPKDKQSFLPYARTDVLSLVLYINQGLDKKGIEKAQGWTRQIVDLALNEGGTYYLPYQRYPTKEEMLKAYPEFPQFVDEKHKYDPDSLFMNQFYQQYE